MHNLPFKVDFMKLNVLDNFIMEFKLDVIVEVLAFLFLGYWTLDYFILCNTVIILIMTITLFIMAAAAVFGIFSKDT